MSQPVPTCQASLRSIDSFPRSSLLLPHHGAFRLRRQESKIAICPHGTRPFVPVVFSLRRIKEQGQRPTFLFAHRVETSSSSIRGPHPVDRGRQDESFIQGWVGSSPDTASRARISPRHHPSTSSFLPPSHDTEPHRSAGRRPQTQARCFYPSLLNIVHFRDSSSPWSPAAARDDSFVNCHACHASYIRCVPASPVVLLCVP